MCPVAPVAFFPWFALPKLTFVFELTRESRSQNRDAVRTGFYSPQPGLHPRPSRAGVAADQAVSEPPERSRGVTISSKGAPDCPKNAARRPNFACALTALFVFSLGWLAGLWQAGVFLLIMEPLSGKRERRPGLNTSAIVTRADQRGASAGMIGLRQLCKMLWVQPDQNTDRATHVVPKSHFTLPPQVSW